jgi:hypothetical protein
MLHKKNIIKYAVHNDAFSGLEPSKKLLPSWLLETPPFTGGLKDNKLVEIPIPTFKICTSFKESFSSGYMITLPVDILVKQTEGGPVVSWRPELNEKFLTVRDDYEQNSLLPTPEGYSEVHFVWETKLSLQIPEGYSFLFTHPFNRYDLPFLTLTGIVDGFYNLPKGNIPVFFKNNFEGIIEKGTPILQILPFKTENWISEIDKSIIEKAEVNDISSATKIFGWYKQNIWKRKNYE